MKRKALLAAIWIILQSAVLYLAWLIFAQLGSGVDATNDTLSGRLEWQILREQLLQFDEWLPLMPFLFVISATPVLFVVPVRRPGLSHKPGRSVFASLAIAGLAIACLASAALLTMLEAFDAIEVLDFGSQTTNWPTFLMVLLAPAWIIATPLLWVFCRRTPREGVLARIATVLFTGSIIEVVAIMPIDVMVRRRTDCYCFAGTFMALALCGGIGLLTLGPAIVLPLLARRRKRWYASRCENCGYDMSGCMSADCCPECGLGWRPGSPATPTP